MRTRTTAKTTAPAFQFYARDWLSSTLGMPWDVAGVYIHLLAWSWDNGPLPNNPEWRARVIGADAARLWPAVATRWKKTARGWINLRLERQREIQAAFSAHAKQAASTRWAYAQAMHTSTPRAMPNASSSSSSSSSSSKDQDQNTPAAQRPVNAPTFKTYAAIATRVLRQTADLDLDAGTLAEELKRAYAKARIPYDATIVAKALEAARHGRPRRRA